MILKNCFQRTYEELKLASAAETAASISGFQRTYEELKQKVRADYIRPHIAAFSAYL